MKLQITLEAGDQIARVDGTLFVLYKEELYSLGKIELPGPGTPADAKFAGYLHNTLQKDADFETY